MGNFSLKYQNVANQWLVMRIYTKNHLIIKEYIILLYNKMFPLDGETSWVKSSPQPVNLPSARLLRKALVMQFSIY